MSSTNKTSLGLNMWEASDKPVRQDFVNDNVIIDEKVTKLEQDFSSGNVITEEKIAKLNSNFANHNMEYHARIYPTTGWISGIINDKIAQGYKGGDIQLVGYAPPDSYLGDTYGIIKWVLVFSDIAHLQFIKARENTTVTRAISVAESFDTGWVVH